MSELLNSIFLIIGCGLWLMSIFIVHFLSNQRLWFAILCGILGGICAGVYMSGFPLGIVSGLIVGIVMNLLVIPSGLLVKYYRKKGIALLQRRDKF